MIDRHELRPAVAWRMSWLRRGALAGLAFLLACLFDMQVLRGTEYALQAEQNSLKKVAVRAPRGLLFDRDGRILVKNRPAFEAVLVVDRVEDAAATLERARAVLALDDPFVGRLRKRLARRKEPEIRLKEDLSLAEVAALEARSWEWPEFRVRQSLVRSYPFGSAAAHALGHMGEIRDEQLQEELYAEYRPGDVIGQSGIEARYERYLRGRDGVRRVLVDNLGREIRAIDRIDPPVPGLDLHLTLDLDVQRAAEEAFGSWRGAAVALDSTSGEVLALVSRPAYDPNAFAGKLTREDWQRYNADRTHPMFDRALLGKLPPGSVFKVVDAIAGLEERVWDPDTALSCSGHTVLHGDVRHCWKQEGHGVVAFREAMRGSCNVYFYHRGDAIGIDRLARWARRLGLGEPTGIDVDPEGRGVVPDPVWKRRVKGEPWWAGETVSVAIGQGALGVSVLQIAQMMQIVANGGRAWQPFLVASAGASGFRRAPRAGRDVALRPDTLGRLRDALWAVVNEPRGTGSRARVEGVDVAGKTGTAQTPPSGPAPEDSREHAWFTGYAPAGKPEVVVAVFVEHGGHGGETAAPIAGAILARALEKRGLKSAPAALVAGAGPAAGTGALPFIGPPRLAGGGPLAASVGAFQGPPRLERRLAISSPVAPAAAAGASPAAGEGVAWAATPRRVEERIEAAEPPSRPVTPAPVAVAPDRAEGGRAEAGARSSAPRAHAGGKRKKVKRAGGRVRPPRGGERVR